MYCSYCYRCVINSHKPHIELIHVHVTQSAYQLSSTTQHKEMLLSQHASVWVSCPVPLSTRRYYLARLLVFVSVAQYQSVCNTFDPRNPSCRLVLCTALIHCRVQMTMAIQLQSFIRLDMILQLWLVQRHMTLVLVSLTYHTVLSQQYCQGNWLSW